MRTKTLLLTAALSAAGVASSMAQGTVYSVNAVGYVNTTVGPGYSLISNPLTAQNNSISALFKGVPDGTQIFKFNGTAFQTATYDELGGDFGPANVASQQILPGEGVFIKNPSKTANLTVTFVGEVPQGPLVNPLPKGLSIRASQVPQAGSATDLGFPGADGDQIFQFDNTKQAYTTATFDSLGGGWDKNLTFKVGEAFFVKKVTAGSWNRTFSVNS